MYGLSIGVYTILSLAFVYGQQCGNENPLSSSDCSIISTSSDSCCYYSGQNGNKSCVWYGAKAYGPQVKDDVTIFCDTIRAETYIVDNMEATSSSLSEMSFFGTGCGPSNPNEMRDCANYSTSNFSCCYIMMNSKGMCVNIGEKAHAPGKVTFQGYHVYCSGEQLRVSYFLFGFWVLYMLLI